MGGWNSYSLQVAHGLALRLGDVDHERANKAIAANLSRPGLGSAGSRRPAGGQGRIERWGILF